jgi:hypothetical protein
MRLVTWNCRVGGFKKKAARMAPDQPHILCVQEVEPVEQAAFDERRRPACCWATSMRTPGSEQRPTHFHLGKRDRPFHLDDCFVPADWASRITSVRVGGFSDWCAMSDYVPLVVDMDVNGLVPAI